MVADLLRRTGNSDAYAVIGHSMGGKVAMTLALHHPKLVARLAVVDVSPVSSAEISHFARYVEGMRALDLAALEDRAQADEDSPPPYRIPASAASCCRICAANPGATEPGAGR